jgi:hypothetical protein
MDLTKEAKLHTMSQIPKLRLALEFLAKANVSTEDDMFAKLLGDTILACDIFMENTKHQHRTMCDVVAGKRA